MTIMRAVKALTAALTAFAVVIGLAACAAPSPSDKTDTTANAVTTATATTTTGAETTEAKTAAVTTATTTAAEQTTVTEDTTKMIEPDSTLRVASYNIKHGADVSLDMSVIAKDITDNNIDIVGFQEIDQMTNRVGGINTMELIAKAAGYDYWKFARGIDYSGGEYGTGILSRYPIESFECIMLSSGGNEQRSIGHAVINVNGTKIDFFNTHLSYESKSVRATQFKEVAAMMAKCERFILTGDFNTADFTEFTVIENSFLANNTANRFGTFTSNSSPIDNIVLTQGIFTIIKTSIGPTGHSDHRMLWSEIGYRAAQ